MEGDISSDWTMKVRVTFALTVGVTAKVIETNTVIMTVTATVTLIVKVTLILAVAVMEKWRQWR